MYFRASIVIFLLLLRISFSDDFKEGPKPNILFIAVDDLRCELGCYGSKLAKTPHLDALASSGIRFDRAYCQQAICGPSRASVMTGLRPDATQIHGNHTHFRSIYPDIVTLPQHFKNHGYHTRSMGKIYHGVFPKGASRTVADTFGDELSWSVPTFRPGPRYYHTEEGITAAKKVYQQIYKPKNPEPDDWTTKLVFGPATEAPDVADDVLYDGQVAHCAVQSLRELAKNPKQSFFLAVGFIKPHSPYIAPKKYWNLYQKDEIPLAEPGTTRKTNVPPVSLHNSGELRRYTDQVKRGPIPDSDQRTVRHAYLACISYIDAQVGRVLAELENLKLAEDTIVVLWSDHGYHLGEKDLWGKTTNFELDTRVPMIIRAPGKKSGVCSSPVELVDLYPTLVELAGISEPLHLQGTSLVPLLDDPETTVKTAAFSQFTRGKVRGYSVRTKSHRYTEWIDLKSGQVKERLLFDHRKDPSESNDISDEADPAFLKRMSQILDRGEGWRRCRASELTLSPMFGDHMVLQRDEPVFISGKGRENDAVKVTWDDQSAETSVDEYGDWSVKFDPLKASDVPKTLLVESGESQLEVNDILIGDVWMCSGQSNMRWMLKQTAEAEASIAGSKNRRLRFFDQVSSIHPGSGKFPLLQLRNTFSDNLYGSDGWRVADPETVPDFSGVAYHFGKMLQAETGIPIGLIHNAIGGSPMEAWIPMPDPNPNWIESSSLPKWVRERARLNLSRWSEHDALPAPHHPFEPGFLYQAAVAPFENFPIKGVIWYQGESNATEDGAGSPAIDSKKNFSTHRQLIESWREGFGSRDLPFYFVQLPGLNRQWAPFREVQQQIDFLIPRTHMAVTLDLGNPTNVHPKRKRQVGERLARLALKNDYQRNIIANPPRLTGWKSEEKSIVLNFDRPLKIDPRAKVAVAGKDRIFRDVKIAIEEGTIAHSRGYSLRLYPLQLDEIGSIRYAWANDPVPALTCAETGIPVAPFRTDNWPLTLASENQGKPEPEAFSAFPVKDAFYSTSFEKVKPGRFESLVIDGATWTARADHVEIDSKHWKHGKQCLHLLGGEKRAVDVHFSEAIPQGSVLEFAAERWTSRSPFEFKIFSRSGAAEWSEIFDGTRRVKVGRSFLSQVRIDLPAATSDLRFVVSSPENSGLLVDNLSLFRPQPMKLGKIETAQPVYPVLIGKPHNPVLDIMVNVTGQIGRAPVVDGLRISTDGTDDLADIDEVNALVNGVFVGEAMPPRKTLEPVFSPKPLRPGDNVVQVSYRLKPSASLDRKVDAACTAIRIDGNWHEIANPNPPGKRRIGFALRNRGQDGVHSARIPGLATTNKGTLIAVYDNRNRSRIDLPGDIDVGMNRSTDGGQTWSPMQVIMDMGDDPKWNYDGIGDPSVLVDRVTGTIWVAATWSHGNRSWRGSGPGLAPEETGQFMLAKSDDDGLTWSEPINITRQIKNPDWRFVLQGPGKGITTRDGTLIFPAQFRGENAEPVAGKPFSTLIYSKDRGQSWKIGTGVQINTTEAQLVELGDGSIMINCRDNRGGSRSVYTTTDLGATWKPHPSNRGVLPEPVCMASLIRLETKKHGPVLFFSNPPQARGRGNMTIKASTDEGMTWPEKWHTLVDSRATAYSCMTAVGDDKIGLVYEAPGELYFVRFGIDELLGR